jgi:HK97 family phage major capsid protein
MPETKIQETLDEVVGLVKGVQETQDKVDAQHKELSAYDLGKQKEMTEKALEGLQTIQDENQKKAAEEVEYKQRLDDLEAQVAKGGGSTAPVGDSPEVKNAFAKFMKRGIPINDEIIEQVARGLVGKSLIGADEHKIESETKDLVAAVGPTGGYFITPDRSDSISTRVFETSPVRPIADIQTTSSDILEIILDDDEPASGWVGETQTRSDTDSADIGLIKIPVHEVFAMPKATQKMLDDAGFDIEAWHNGKVSRKFSRTENTAFVVGDGSKKPKGFLAYPAWASAGTYERDAVEQITATGTAGALDNGDDIIKLKNALIEDYQKNATWGMERATFGDIMVLKDSSGRYLLNRNVLAEDAALILLGSPVVFMADMPSVAAAALPVVVGDFREFYTVVDRFGIRIIRDELTTKGYVKFYTTKRVGGAVTNFEAGKILKINS